MSDEIEADFEGIFYHWCCPHCDEINQDENDIRGSEVECDSCGEGSVVSS